MTFEEGFEVLITCDFTKGPLSAMVHVEVIVVVQVNVVRREGRFLDREGQVGQIRKRLEATALAF